MKTIIFEAPIGVVRRYAHEHLIEPSVRCVGRLTAVQSESLDDLDELALREIAEAYNLPLRAVREQPPFDRALPSGRKVRARRAVPQRLPRGDGS